MTRQKPSTRVEEIHPQGEAFFAWALAYSDQEALMECLQTVVMAAFVAGWDAREKVVGEPMTNDQPMPKQGITDVTPVAKRMFIGLLEAQSAKGLATYGTTLQTFNGRDALLDGMQECVDLFQYLVQAKLERDALREENARLRAQVILLGGTP